jgi:hypothetical protein
LREHNPKINWKEGTLQWRTTTMKEVLDKEEHLNKPVNASDKVLLEYLGMEKELWIDLKKNLATKQEDLIIVYMNDILAFSKTINGLKKIK